MEYWILIHGESDAEYGLLRHCAALTEPDGYAAALVCEGEDPDRAFAAVRRGSISCTEDWTRSSAALKSPRSHGRCSQMQLYAVLAIRGG